MGRILDPQATGVNDPNEIIQKFHGAFFGGTRSVSSNVAGKSSKSMVFMGTSSRNGGFAWIFQISLSINGGFSCHLCGQWRVQSNDKNYCGWFINRYWLVVWNVAFIFPYIGG
jgi:hypothetical protein